MKRQGSCVLLIYPFFLSHAAAASPTSDFNLLIKAGVISHGDDNLEKAGRCFSKAFDLGKANANSNWVLSSTSLLSNVYLDQRNPSKAESCCLACLNLVTDTSLDETSKKALFQVRSNLAQAYIAQSQFMQAEQTLRALKAAPTSEVLALMGRVYRELDRKKEADSLYQALIATHEATLPRSQVELALDLQLLAMYSAVDGNYEQEKALLTRSEDVLAKRHDLQLALINSLQCCNRVLKRINLDREACQLQQQIDMMTKLEPSDNPV